MIDILVIVAVGIYCLLIGILIGQWQERRWQRERGRMNQELDDCQREVNQIIAAEYSSRQQTQEYFSNRVH